MHLCANLLLSNLIPAGMKIRRNFSFWPGEKSWLNRAYRSLVDRWLARRYRLTDYFFDLTQSIRGEKNGSSDGIGGVQQGRTDDTSDTRSSNRTTL